MASDSNWIPLSCQASWDHYILQLHHPSQLAPSFMCSLVSLGMVTSSDNVARWGCVKIIARLWQLIDNFENGWLHQHYLYKTKIIWIRPPTDASGCDHIWIIFLWSLDNCLPSEGRNTCCLFSSHGFKSLYMHRIRCIPCNLTVLVLTH